MEYRSKYEEWIQSPLYDEESKKELLEIANNEEEIKDRFYKDLEFGVSGLRGIIGSGTNRMNRYTVTKTTQGIANFIIKEQAQEKGVVIAYDSRRMSYEFSEMVALCFNANGIKTYLFDELRPTPELSFAVRELNAIAGIVITASHNPPEYNGYKVYWADGGQMVFPKDNQIIDEVENVKYLSNVKSISKQEAIDKKLFNIIGKEVDDRYIEEIKKNILNQKSIDNMQSNLKIVYTPLYGTGNKLVQRILKEVGFENVYVVPEQQNPDSNFTTIKQPNPEDPRAFELALKLAEEKNADIVLATDPDADRVGIYAKDYKTGEYKRFSGNMSAILIAEYLFSQMKEKNIIVDNPVMIKSIVSTNLAEAVAKEYNVKLMEVLTGFKYIGKKIKEFEESGINNFVFGFEESFGCLHGTYTRDKDAVSTIMTICEMAAFYKEKGIGLWDQMINIYEKYGYYQEKTISITLKGITGYEKMMRIMSKLRQNQITQLSNYKVRAIRDYDVRRTYNLENKQQEIIGLPKTDAIYYQLDNDAWVCVRPSGTEPKIRIYMGVKGSNMDEANMLMDDLEKDVRKLI